MQVGIIVLLTSMLTVHFVLNDQLSPLVLGIIAIQLLLIGSVMVTGVYLSTKMSNEVVLGWILLLTGATFAFLKVYVAEFVYDLAGSIPLLIFFVLIPAPLMAMGLTRIARPSKIGIYIFWTFATVKVGLELWWFFTFNDFMAGKGELSSVLDLNYSIILVLDALFAIFLVIGLPSALGPNGTLESYLTKNN